MDRNIDIKDKDRKNRMRYLLKSQMRAECVRNQIIEAYSILENINFDCVSDTAFQDKIYTAKIHLESALDDFLLDPTYWKQRINKEIESWNTDEKKKKERKRAILIKC